MQVTTRNALHDHPMLGNDTRKSSRKRKDYTEPEDDEEDIASPPVKKARKKKRSYKYKPTAGSSTKGGRWTYEEKKMFLNGVLKFGRGKWSSIAQDIPSRYVSIQHIYSLIVFHVLTLFLQNGGAGQDSCTVSIQEIRWKRPEKVCQGGTFIY